MELYLSDSQLLGLGRITGAFSSLEGVVAGGIQMAISSEQDIGRMVAAQLSFTRATGLLYAILKDRLGEGAKLDELGRCLSAASQAEQRRNQIVHSEWWPDGSGEGLRMKSGVKSGKGFVSQVEELSPDDIEKVAEEIWSARLKLAEFLSGLAMDGILPGVLR